MIMMILTSIQFLAMTKAEHINQESVSIYAINNQNQFHFQGYGDTKGIPIVAEEKITRSSYENLTFKPQKYSSSVYSHNEFKIDENWENKEDGNLNEIGNLKDFFKKFGI
jgi:hypothetical protein